MNRYPLTQINDALGDENIVLVFCIGFEARSIASARALDPQKITRALAFFPDKNTEQTEVNRSIISQHLGQNLSCYQTFLDNPLASTDSILKGLSENLNGLDAPKVIVDITSFTKEILLILLKILEVNREKFGSIQFIYNPAAQLNSSWLSDGVAETRAVLGYSGEFLPSKSTHLVILAGLELERIQAIILAYEPELISIGTSRVQDYWTKEFHREHQAFFEFLRENYRDQVRFFEFSATDPEQTRNDIGNHLVPMGTGQNLIIAPVSNKVSTLGVGLYALRHTEAQVCYAQAITYNASDYSVPGEDVYIYSLDF